MGPPMQNRWCQINVVFVRPASMGVRRPACSLEVPMDSTPLVEWSFMTGRPMFPLWVIQLLPTSPGDPTSCCNQNET